MADIFISYKREDRAIAEQIDRILRDRRYTVWWDTSLVAGEHFVELINKELTEAKAVLVLWSKASWSSKWVREEALYAHDHEKLVTARLDDVQIGVPFRSFQTTNLQNWDGKPDAPPTKEVLAGLRRYTGTPSVPTEVSKNATINVFQFRFDVSHNFARVESLKEFWEGVKKLTAEAGINIRILGGTGGAYLNSVDHFGQFIGQINFFVYFGSPPHWGEDSVYDDGVQPFIEKLANVAKPYVIQVGAGGYDIADVVAGHRASRLIPASVAALNEKEFLADNMVQRIAAEIVYWVCRVRSTS